MSGKVTKKRNISCAFLGEISNSLFLSYPNEPDFVSLRA